MEITRKLVYGPKQYKDTAPDIVLNEIVSEELWRKTPHSEKEGRSDKGKERSRYDVKLPGSYRSKIASCNRRGIAFNLTLEQYFSLLKLPCFYCGTSHKIGIDRIDSWIGYEEDNSVPCCTACNMMKHTLSTNDFLRKIHQIYHHRKMEK